MYLGVSTDASSEPAEGDDLLLGDDVLQVGDGAVQVHLLDGLGCLAGVLQDTREKMIRAGVVGGLRIPFCFWSRMAAFKLQNFYPLLFASLPDSCETRGISNTGETANVKHLVPVILTTL